VGADRTKIRDYLADLSAADPYKGVTGKIRFRPDGDPVDKGFVMTRVKRNVLQVESGQ
jgi:ABC-type branched-subunit amino acid transport system substrate-binding protein